MSVNDEGNAGSDKDPTNAGTDRPDGKNPDGAVPGQEEGVGLGAGSEPNTFEPEEDPEVTEESKDTSGETSKPS